MPRECCRAHIWPNGIFFADETHSWDEVREQAIRIEELRYMPRWHPWNTIYKVTKANGKVETYATHEHAQNRNYKNWYRRNRERGLCTRCSRPTGTNRCMCNACRARHNEQERVRRLKRQNNSN